MTMTVGELVTEVTGALAAVIPNATIAVFIGAGVVFALVARFGGRLIRLGR